ncbi:MAG: DUF4113 domain-containing protein [Pyrinomonadaceae bacterium]
MQFSYHKDQSNRFDQRAHFSRFTASTSDLPARIRLPQVRRILLGLLPRKAETRRLFNEHLFLKDRELLGAIDIINAKHGRQTVRFGIPIKPETHWKMNRNFLSQYYTTNIDQILRVVA